MALTTKDLQAIQTLFLPVYGRLDKMDDRFDGIDLRLDKLDSEVSSLKSGQLEIRRELKSIDRRVSDTYQLALDTWGTSTENRAWLEGINSKQM